MDQDKTYGLTRRRLLRGTALGMFGTAGVAMLAACGEAQVVTKEVIKEVPVETIVEKVVIKEVPVETIVEKEVIKEVPVEKIVKTEVIKEVPVEKVVIKEVIKEVRTTVATSVKAGEPVFGGDLRMSWGGPLANASFNIYTQISSDQGMVTAPVGCELAPGNSWGDGKLPTLEHRFADGVAKSYEEVAPDESYTFTLDERATFHDGSPVTADDFMYTVQIACDPAYGVNYGTRQLDQLKGFSAWSENPTDDIQDTGGITKIDDMTINITTDGVKKAFWASPNPIHPFPKHVWDKLDPATAFDSMALTPTGAGPFKFIRYVDQQFAELERHDKYHHGAPYVDRYIVQYAAPDALDAAAERGELDYLRTGSIETYSRLTGMSHMIPQPMMSPFSSLIFLNHNVFAEKYPDVDVALMTEAMVRGADREGIAANIQKGTVFPGDNQFSHVRSMSDVPVRQLPYNEEEAKALLEESGWNPDDTLTWLNWSAPGADRLALQANWADIGLKVAFDVIDRAAVVHHLWETGTNEMVVANLGGSQDVGDSFKRMGCEKIWPSGYNYHHMCIPELDALYQAAFDAPNKDELKARWIDISEYLHGRGTMIAGKLWGHSLMFMYHKRVQGPWWMNNYAVPVRKPFQKVWLDPRWQNRWFQGE